MTRLISEHASTLELDIDADRIVSPVHPRFPPYS